MAYRPCGLFWPFLEGGFGRFGGGPFSGLPDALDLVPFHARFCVLVERVPIEAPDYATPRARQTHGEVKPKYE